MGAEGGNKSFPRGHERKTKASVEQRWWPVGSRPNGSKNKPTVTSFYQIEEMLISLREEMG